VDDDEDDDDPPQTTVQMETLVRVVMMERVEHLPLLQRITMMIKNMDQEMKKNQKHQNNRNLAYQILNQKNQRYHNL